MPLAVRRQPPSSNASLHRPWTGQDIGENSPRREFIEQENRCKPEVEHGCTEPNQQEKYQQSPCAEALVVERPRWRKDVFEDVRPIQRWNWNEIESRERQIDQHPVQEHRLKDCGCVLERGRRPSDESDQNDQRN